MEIMPPFKGARFDIPVHKLEPDMLAAGSYNVVCDPTNILRARKGFTLLAQPGPTKPITGGVSWEGVGGKIYTIVADNQNWWQFTSGAATPWTPLNNPAPVGDDDFTVFANIAVGGVDNLYGVNNGPAGLLQWIAGNNYVSSVTGLPFSSALGCFILANRLVVYGTTEQGVLYPHRVRWSQVNNPTVFPLAALADLGDSGGNIKAGLRFGNLQAVFYIGDTQGTGTIQSMIAQAGDDANAFSFQEQALGEGVIPPASVAAIVPVLGLQYYLGIDGHVWTFDGIAPQNFGVAIQSDVQQNSNEMFLKRSFAVYVPDDRHIRFFFPSGQSAYPDRCVYYQPDFQRWEAPAIYQQPFRAGFTGPLNAATEEAAFLGGAATGGVFHLDAGDTDNGLPIQFNATWGAINTDPLQEMAVQFVEAFIQQAQERDVISLIISGLRTPLDVAMGGAVFLMNLSQATQFQQIAAPGIDFPSNTYFNWLQVSLQGVVSGTLACLGGYVHVTTQQKGVYNLHGRGPE